MTASKWGKLTCKKPSEMDILIYQATHVNFTSGIETLPEPFYKRKIMKTNWATHVAEGVLLDNVISNLTEVKTLVEYKYMIEHYYIYTITELKTVLSTFISNYNFDECPELIESYNQAFEYLQNG